MRMKTIVTIKRTIIRKVRKETILKLYNTLVLPTFLYGSENWTLTASQRRRIEAAEMKLLRPLAGYTFYDYKQTNPFAANYRQTAYWTRQMNTEGTGSHTYKEYHKTEFP